MAIIQVEHLSKIFRIQQKQEGLWGAIRGLVRREYLDKTALDAVSVTIDPGEMVGLVGANGAGKTTFMKLLTGIIHPTSGVVRVLDAVPYERQLPFRRQIALVMGQKAQLWWDLPASDGFALLRAMYEIPLPLFRERLRDLAEQLEVAHLLATPVRRLSLGERMKMELIAALLHAPKVIFLDEPTIGLDFSSQRIMRQFLLAYRRQHQATMLITSHYMDDIEQLCDRLLIMRDGGLIYDGPLDEVREQYASDKMITVHLQADVPITVTTAQLATLGCVVEQNADLIRVQVPPSQVTQTVSQLFAWLPVHDVDIEGVDIAVIIDALMKGANQLRSPCDAVVAAGA